MTDQAALEALYDATGGDGWNNRTNWKTSAPLHEWYGVTTDPSGRVVNLDLAYNSLSGPIPLELGDLSSLVGLDLTGNSLNGSLPTALTNLTSVTELNLAFNSLSGPIPSELGNLTSLTRLHLAGNSLSGPIPTELGRLTSLSRLELAHNSLSGPIPSELGNLASLIALDLAGNSLSGSIPSELGRLTGLTRLDLDFNPLSGSIPTELGRLSGLTSLHLTYTSLSGSIPTQLGELTNLTTVRLNNNFLSGPIPAALGKLSNLDGLRLSDNFLSGPIPAELGGLTVLDELSLSHNSLSGPIPHELGNLSNLRFLYVDNFGLCLAQGFPVASPFGMLAESRGLSVCGDDPSVTVSFAQPTYTATEGGPGARVVVGLSARLDREVTIALNTKGTDGITMDDYRVEAVSPARVTASSDPDRDGQLDLTFGANTASATLMLTAVADADRDPGELYIAILDGPEDMTKETPAFTRVQLLEAGPQTTTATVSFVQPTYAVSEGGPGAAVAVRLSAALDRAVTVTLNTDGTGGVTGADYTLEATPPARLAPTSDPARPWLLDLTLAANTRNATLMVTAVEDPEDDPGDLYIGIVGVPAGVTEGALGFTRVHIREAGSPSADRAVLEALYRSTGGPNWTNDANWLTNEPLSTWHGVRTDGDGRVTRLTVPFNALAGQLPSGLGSLTALTHLFLGDNPGLVGGLPADVGDLANLVYLDVNDSGLTGTIPLALGKLRSLSWLQLGNNALAGGIPRELGDMASLETLDLHGNELAGEIPVELARLSNLTDLGLADNGLTGGIPVELGGLSNLTRLSLSYNELTDGIPVELGALPNLTTLALSDNGLTGDIPVELGDLVTLADLHLGNNELTGGVPAFLGDLPNLERLSLGGNELGGGIPATLGSLGNLWELELRNSGLTGPVPTELGSLANLTHLSLDGNELMGPVPAEFGNLTDLAYLYLNGNAELTGPLPLSLTRLSRLAVLDVSASALCAPADAAFQSWLATVDFRGDTCAVPNRPPQPVGTIPAQTLREGGVETVDVASAFGDPDGDMLTYRAASSAPHVVTARAAGARVTLTAVSEGTATIRVTATDPGGLSGAQAFTVTVTAMRVPFTDDPIVPGVTPIRAIHFTELRTRIDALRSVVGLARFSWTDPVLRAEVTRVRRVHVLELRQALAEAYQASARTTPRWTDPSPGAGTPIRALHVTELRAAVLALE